VFILRKFSTSEHTQLLKPGDLKAINICFYVYAVLIVLFAICLRLMKYKSWACNRW